MGACMKSNTGRLHSQLEIFMLTHSNGVHSTGLTVIQHAMDAAIQLNGQQPKSICYA